MQKCLISEHLQALSHAILIEYEEVCTAAEQIGRFVVGHFGKSVLFDFFGESIDHFRQSSFIFSNNFEEYFNQSFYKKKKKLLISKVDVDVEMVIEAL